MIIEKIYEKKARKIKKMPCRSNRASELGHECLRYLVYTRTHWEEKLLHDIKLQLIFDEGNLQEEVVLQDLKDAGFKVYGQQSGFEIKDLEITGHMDCVIEIDYVLYPCEVKSMSPHIFEKVSKLEDFFNPRYPWLHKYPGQLMLYMLAKDIDRGVFLLKNKSTGELKEIWVDLDWDMADELFEKARQVNEHISRGSLPDRLEVLDPCQRCHFRHICLPEKDFGPGVIIEDHPAIEMMLERLGELQGAKEEYDDIERKLKNLLEGKEAIIGRWFISGNWIERGSYKVDATRYWNRWMIDISEDKKQHKRQSA